MAGFEESCEKLRELGVSVVAASVDSQEKGREVAAGLSFPIAHGVTREDAEALGAWWDAGRGFIQPSEFVIRQDGKVFSATYSTGPIGRLDAADVVSLVSIVESRRQKSG